MVEESIIGHIIMLIVIAGWCYLWYKIPRWRKTSIKNVKDSSGFVGHADRMAYEKMIKFRRSKLEE